MISLQKLEYDSILRSEKTKFTKKSCNLELQDIDMIQESVQRLLNRGKNEDNYLNQSSPSIYMVPHVIRDLSPSSFDPQLVSIGPLHREHKNVQEFEGQKAAYMLNLMRRINSPQEEILESCMQKAYNSMNKIKACYKWRKVYSDADIAEMMVMDACFILEYMIEHHISANPLAEKILQTHVVLHDLMLLENQIPLFFVDEIFQATVLKRDPNILLIKLIYPILSWNSIFQTSLNIANVSISNTDHILSILHQIYKPQDDTKVDNMSWSRIHTAVEIDRAGVNIKPNKDPTWVMGMEVKQHRYARYFGSWINPTLTMPVLRVHDSTELVFRNLIAYESTFKTQRYVTSYAFVMDMLVNTQEDVAKLMESRVLNNFMGSNEEAANMINNICKNVSAVSYYVEECEKLNKHCNSYWPKQIAKMRSTYFNSPWSIIALVSGIILFVLQVVQTIYTINSSGSNNSKSNK
ncbi:hypothetical protein QVD17_17389 [Tagetes erecta]|uniref:Uncharacterized protein n=1 Tax=Tagetes erecta TaxID=13708 RepID=A0AAD8P096_TARER|nr:hypothetical protein QVD17_17389 [Tagetes erecta]